MQEVSVQMAIGFTVADHRLYCRAAPEFLLDLTKDAAFLPGLEDPEGLGRGVAPVALVDIDPLDLAPRERLGFFQHLFQGVAVIGISGERFGVEDELAALGPFVGGGERDLDAELVGCRPGPSFTSRLSSRRPAMS